MFRFCILTLCLVYVSVWSENCLSGPNPPLQWLVKGNLTGDSFPIAILSRNVHQVVMIQTLWTNTTLNIPSGEKKYNVYWIDIPTHSHVSFFSLSLQSSEVVCTYETDLYKFKPESSYSINTVTLLYSSLTDVSKTTMLSEFTFSGGLGGEFSVKFDVFWKQGECTSLSKLKIRNWREISDLLLNTEAMQTFPYQQGYQNRSPCPDGGMMMTLKVEYANGMQKDFNYLDYTSDCNNQRTETRSPYVYEVMDRLGSMICQNIGKSTSESCQISHNVTRNYLLDTKCVLENKSEEDAKKAFLGIFVSGIIILSFVSICLVACFIVIWRRRSRKNPRVHSHALEDENDFDKPQFVGTFVLGDEDEMNEDEMEAKLIN